jgi:hypothetical protein
MWTRITANFFRQFRMIIVINDTENPTFVSPPLASFLRTEKEQHIGPLVRISCAPG